MEPEFMLFAFPLKVDIEKAPENLQMELINVQCNTNLNQKYFKQIARSLFLLAKRKNSFTQVFWVKNDGNARQHVCVCVNNFFLL
jgi:hypothetical protein